MVGVNSRYEKFIEEAKAYIPPDKNKLLPQAGFQYNYLRSPADIAIGGGSAGGGKTFALILECARYRNNPEMAAMVFRRLTGEITNPGGLWDEARKVYSRTTGGEGTGKPHTWHFPGPRKRNRGARVVFNHLQYDDTKLQHHGGQYPLVCFDELTTFLEDQFWYLLSRNRTTIGIKPYMRCTTNPESSGWVKSLIEWFLYPDDHPDLNLAGYPIPERSGKIRYFTRMDELIYWGNSKQEVLDKCPWLFEGDPEIDPLDKIKSLTFIGGSVYENKALLHADPSYIGNLMALKEQDRNRLLYGCWRYIPGLDELFDYSSLLDFWNNDYVKRTNQPHDRYITADIALEGSDLFVVMVWDNLRLIKVEAYEKSPGPAIVQTIKNLATEYNVPRRNIVYDRDGAGGFLAGYLPGALGFRNNGSPQKVRGKKEPPENYENLKTQCAYMAAEYVEKALMYAEPGCMTDWMRERLIQECRAHMKRDREKEGKLRISNKEEVRQRIKRSPDFFDAFIMRMIFLLIRKKVSQTA